MFDYKSLPTYNKTIIENFSFIKNGLTFNVKLINNEFNSYYVVVGDKKMSYIENIEPYKNSMF